MRSTFLLCLVASAVLSSAAAAQDAIDTVPLPSVDLPPVLERILRDYEVAWQSGDAEALSALFTPDGFVPTGRGWARGPAAIQAAYADASGGLQLRAHGYAMVDTVGYIVGAATRRLRRRRALERG